MLNDVLYFSACVLCKGFLDVSLSRRILTASLIRGSERGWFHETWPETQFSIKRLENRKKRNRPKKKTLAAILSRVRLIETPLPLLHGSHQ